VEIRDPIHGLIEYSSLEERVINSRAFQRLRGIHQLAMAYLVYPGALHTRFDHSLGVMHVAGEMAASLNARYGDELFGSEDRDTIRLAALLHDVGHGPFSHVSETPLAALSRDQELLRQPKINPEKLHEQVTIDIVTHDRELQAILGERRFEIVKIIGHQGVPSVSQSIVSGSLDADKLDYLLRDSHFCGVKYGVYDLERVLDGIRVVAGPWSDSYLGVSEESVPAIEQHLMARYQMTRQVYRHRIRRSTDALLSRAIIAAATAGCEELRRLYTYGGDPGEFCQNWLRYDDRRVTDTILTKCGGTDSSRLVERLISRRLPLHVAEMDLESAGDLFLQSKLAKPDRRSELERRIADRLGAQPCEVIVDLVQTNPPKPSSTEPDIDPEAIYVQAETEVRPFSQVSDIFRENPVSGTRRLVIFVPFSGLARNEREEERERLSEQVREVMAEWGKEA
jgi:HD superfamily phosphohydrolase